MPTDPRNLGPDGKDVDVSGEHLDQATACLSTATARRDVQTVAQAIANAEARGLHAIDRPRGRMLDHNTTAHRIARDLAGPIREGGPTEEERDRLEAHLRDALADAYAAGRADQLAEQIPAGVALTAEQWTEVRRLFFSMPYAGSPSGRRTGEGGPADAVDLVEWLRGLQRVLVVVGRQQSEAHAELDQLRTQRERAREYLGAGLLGLLALAEHQVTDPLDVAHRAETIPLHEEAAQLAADQAIEDARTAAEETEPVGDLWEKFTITSTTHGDSCPKCAHAAEAAALHAAVTGSVGASYDDDGHRAEVDRISKP